jgi:ureidoacrylate peracid hydrolase
VLVVVDYQNDFCHPDGAITILGQSTESARAILPGLQRLIQTARGAGVPRVFFRVAHSEWTDAPAWRARGAGGDILDTSRLRIAEEGSWGAEFYELEPRKDELILAKHRYSAFAHTPLKLVLQAKQASHVVLAGVQTNVCVHATARDAVQEGFTPVVVEECVAAGTEVEHRVSLEDIRTRMGPVVSLDPLCAEWERATPMMNS